MNAYNKAIIYDDSCPLCVWYTNQFVRFGLLQEGNRISFAELEGKALATQLDMHKSKHEIPLVDLSGGNTIYGLDSLLDILAQKLPVLPRLINISPVRAFFTALYKLISYNRRVIVAAPKSCHTFDCTPDFNAHYRRIYIAITTLVAILLWGMYSQFFLKSIFLFFSIAGLVLLPFSFFLTIENQETRLAYFGQVATTCLIGGLLLLPTPLLSLWIEVPLGLCLINGGLSSAMMWKEWRRRKKVIDC